MPRVLSRDVLLPEYGLSLGLVRLPGQRWRLAGALDIPGPLRLRLRRRKPRGSQPVRAYARDTR